MEFLPPGLDVSRYCEVPFLDFSSTCERTFVVALPVAQLATLLVGLLSVQMQLATSGCSRVHARVGHVGWFTSGSSVRAGASQSLLLMGAGEGSSPERNGALLPTSASVRDDFTRV